MNLSLVIELTILALAIFLGFEVISKVPAMLHTPLMSGTNFIHGIVIVGAIIVLGEADDTFLKVIGFVAMVLATANVVGGWFVTDRMLEMFKKRPEPKKESAEHVISPSSNLIGLLYLVTIICFILALRFLSSPKHARRGNWIGGVGMIIAIASTLLLDGIGNWALIVVGGADRRGRRPRRRAQGEDDRDAADGGPVQRGRRRRGGARRAGRVPHRDRRPRRRPRSVSTVLSALIGSISFAGSMIAFAKLQELAQRPADHLPGPEHLQHRGPRSPRSGSGSRSSPASTTSGCCGCSSRSRSSSACCSCCRSAAPTCRS